MKILTILVFLVISIGTDCRENVFENFKDKNILMEHVENSPHDVFYEKPQDNDNTIRTKKYISEPAGRIQYMIIKKIESAPQRRKYSVAQSRAEQIMYYNKNPSNFVYSIPHRTRARPIKIVRNGPVKHIYLNLPKYIIKPPQILHNQEIEPSGLSNHYYQHDVGQQENHFTPSVQNDFVPSDVKLSAISEVSKETPSQELNTVSSGYSIDGTNDEIQNYGQEFSNSANTNKYEGHEYNFAQKNSPQVFNNPDHSSFSPQFTTSKFEFMQSQFPQFSPDGKEQYSYEIPDEYKSLFSNNDFLTNSQFNQPQISAEHQFQSSPYQKNNHLDNVSNQPQMSAQHQFQSIPFQENYHADKMRRISDISGFEPDLINMVNAALSHKHESPGNINSNEKPVHVLHSAVSPAFKANFN